jgi:hypothetical protein
LRRANLYWSRRRGDLDSNKSRHSLAAQLALARLSAPNRKQIGVNIMSARNFDNTVSLRRRPAATALCSLRGGPRI